MPDAPTQLLDGDYRGLLLIGDPHVIHHVPGFRKDDYPSVVLRKLAWSLGYAREHRLMPALLGDLFDRPRDNANWLLVKLLDTFDRPVAAIYGNHDCSENTLSPNDSLSILVQARRLVLLDDQPWHGEIGGRTVVLGGTSWGTPLPEAFTHDEVDADNATVVWLTHHDINMPGYEGRPWLSPREIAGIDLVVNGHIHRRLDEQVKGRTRWITPGNISRIARGDATREHTPSVLRVDITADGYSHEWVEVPHASFDDVFHAQVLEQEQADEGSAFIRGLAQLQAHRTADGRGLAEFLDQNLNQFDEPVAREIRELARQVLDDNDHTE